MSAARYVVEFEQPDVPATNISDKMLESLRRSVGRQGCNWDGKVESMMLKYNGDDDDDGGGGGDDGGGGGGGDGGGSPARRRHRRLRTRALRTCT